MKRKVFALALLCGCFAAAHGQSIQAPTDPGSIYPKMNVPEHKPLAYPPIREADVVYCKRIERIIDTREKKNIVMNWPKNPFYKIIHSVVAVGDSNFTGELKVYANDSLTRPLMIKDINSIGRYCETIPIQIGPGPYDTKDSLVCTLLDFKDIKRWEIVEDWIFDARTSQFYPRIVAIAPLYNPTFNGVQAPEQPMFYISWAEVRPFISNEEVFNPWNDVRMSYLDFFEQRLFSSHITKESNSSDLAIKDMPEFKTAPAQALLESQQVQNELIDKEADLWEY